MYDKILARRIMKLVKKHLTEVINEDVNYTDGQKADVTLALSLLDLLRDVIRLDEITLI